MQAETYLQDTDFNDIKRFDSAKKLGNYNSNINNVKQIQHANRLSKQHPIVPNQIYTHEQKILDNQHTKRGMPNLRHMMMDEFIFADSHKLISRQKRGINSLIQLLKMNMIFLPHQLELLKFLLGYPFRGDSQITFAGLGGWVIKNLEKLQTL